MARSKIIKDFISSKMDIDTALQNLIAILYCLEDEVLINWAKKELAGYNDYDELPEYRKLKGVVKASFFVGHCKYSNMQFSISHLDKEIQNTLLNSNLYLSISTIMDMINKNGSFGRAIPLEFYPLLQSNSNAHIIDALVEVNIASVNDVISKVKTKILETLLFIEKEFGNLDELDIDISIKSKEELENIIQFIKVDLYDNSISIGNNNKIKDSELVTNK